MAPTMRGRESSSHISRPNANPQDLSFVLGAPVADTVHQPLPEPPGASPMSTLTPDPTVVIRAARGSDGGRLAQLARLDSQRPLAGEILVAEQGGELVAALGADHAIADPFRPTADLVALLRVRSGGAPATSPRRGIARIPHLRTA